MAEEKILHLTLKKKWFDMIASGEKPEEYREIKPYWISRLVDGIEQADEKDIGAFYWKVGYYTMSWPIDFDFIIFKNGYAKNSPQLKVECKYIVVDKPNKNWCDECPEYVFVIKLGKIISSK